MTMQSRRPAQLLAFAIASLGSLSALGLTPRYVNTGQIVLSYRTDPGVPVEQAKVWISRDFRRTWQPVANVVSTPGSVRFQAQADGRYEVYMVLVNSAGQSAPEPQPGAQAHSVIVVDTTPPLLQVHRSAITEPSPGMRYLQLDLTLIEEHLHEHGVRLFYRHHAGDAWRDGGIVRIEEERGSWPVPADLNAPFQILLVTADQAGNRARSEPFEVLANPTDLPVTKQIPSDLPAGAGVRTFASPAPLTSLDPEPVVQAVDPQRLARLRARVAERLDRGDLDDAEALLSVALNETPTQPDLLSDLGSVMYRMQRFDEASQQYRAALMARPNDGSALAGLALVAQTERRYPEARTHLRHLLEVSDDSPLIWLRFGDVENRLGNRSSARQAWQRTLNLAQDQVLRQRAQTRLQQFPDLDEDAVASHAEIHHSEIDQAAAADRAVRRRAVSEATRS
jgi:tetratricopeptide (TPR) repeat protein